MNTTPIQFTKESLAVTRWASKDATRQNLAGVLVEPDGLQVATNGHGLATLRKPLIEELAGAADAVDEPRVIRATDIDAAIKALPKASKGDDLPRVAYQVGSENGHIDLRAGTARLEVERIAEQFPNWRQCVPGSGPRLTIGVDPTYLAMVAASCKDLGVTCVAMSFTLATNDKGESDAPNQPMQFDATNADGMELRIVLIPKYLGAKQ